MSLCDLEIGAIGTVTGVGASGALRQRLLDMGLIPNAEVELTRVAATGSPVWIKLRGSQLALRRAEAQAIMVAQIP